jgi:3-oxoacyl-[acyl-carrier protein] reductase
MSLDETAVAITGAGAGMGRATARLFAERGASVAAVDVDGGAAGETADLIADGGGTAVAIEADVSDPAAVEGFVEEVVETFGGLDVLHNNAGIPQQSTPVEEVEEAT